MLNASHGARPNGPVRAPIPPRAASFPAARCTCRTSCTQPASSQPDGVAALPPWNGWYRRTSSFMTGWRRRTFSATPCANVFPLPGGAAAHSPHGAASPHPGDVSTPRPSAADSPASGWCHAPRPCASGCPTAGWCMRTSPIAGSPRGQLRHVPGGPAEPRHPQGGCAEPPCCAVVSPHGRVVPVHPPLWPALPLSSR